MTADGNPILDCYPAVRSQGLLEIKQNLLFLLIHAKLCQDFVKNC